ncbi:uncharacterized protein LOC129591624 isoform X2 [Paramacrobiotus metropolitanus]|uniref:uncharacterized protein LOC129591624 isoform X2 n=1 Tax=Paramacrobiotus metropolitanus TaxID=2943436 RepID=UPI0024456CE8|nr:uncharacterized protein LOC129591624 isoform X2 [Paramacrobiotus metropolitanus]
MSISNDDSDEGKSPVILYRRPSKKSEDAARKSIQRETRPAVVGLSRRSRSLNKRSTVKHNVEGNLPPSAVSAQPAEVVQQPRDVDITTVGAVAIQFDNNRPLDALSIQPTAQLVQPPITDINRILNDTAVFPVRDPMLIEIHAPPPYPVDLIDPHQRHVSITAADHQLDRIKLLQTAGTSVRQSAGLKEINLHKFFVRRPSVLTEAAMRLTIKRNSQDRDRASTLADSAALANDLPTDAAEAEILVSERKALLAELETDDSRRFKDVLADILKPTYKKWSKLCQEEFPDGIMWKPDGNLAALVIAYFEACSLKGAKLNLKSFFMRNLPPVLWLRRSLLSLNISFNSFEEMPESLFHLKKLVVLKARNNPIKTIGNGIQKLENLRYLSLSFCMFETFPERSLRVLNVSGNIMSELPACLVRLPKLVNIIAADSYVTLTWGRKSPTTSRQLCSLQELSADAVAAFLTNNGLEPRQLSSGALPQQVQKILHTAHTCEWCSGCRFGHGHELVKAENLRRLRFASLVIKYQVCERCCSNPYRVFSAKDLERYINAGLKELEKMERNEKDKRERENTVKRIKKSLKSKRNTSQSV